MKLGARIRQARQSKGLSQEALDVPTQIYTFGGGILPWILGALTCVMAAVTLGVYLYRRKK